MRSSLWFCLSFADTKMSANDVWFTSRYLPYCRDDTGATRRFLRAGIPPGAQPAPSAPPLTPEHMASGEPLEKSAKIGVKKCVQLQTTFFYANFRTRASVNILVIGDLLGNAQTTEGLPSYLRGMQ